MANTETVSETEEILTKLDAMHKKLIMLERRVRRVEKETTGSSLQRPEKLAREDL